MIEKVRLAEKFAQFSETWSPKIVGEVNDAHIKLVKLKKVSSPKEFRREVPIG